MTNFAAGEPGSISFNSRSPIASLYIETPAMPCSACQRNGVGKTPWRSAISDIVICSYVIRVGDHHFSFCADARRIRALVFLSSRQSDGEAEQITVTPSPLMSRQWPPDVSAAPQSGTAPVIGAVPCRRDRRISRRPSLAHIDNVLPPRVAGVGARRDGSAQCGRNRDHPQQGRDDEILVAEADEPTRGANLPGRNTGFFSKAGVDFAPRLVRHDGRRGSFNVNI